MPLPKVGHKNKKTFLQDCMEDSTMNEEFSNSSQRYAVCLNIWNRHNKSKGNNEEIKWESINNKGFLLY